MSSLPSGTVTFLFNDFEGSTKLAQLHPSSWEASCQRHDAVLREAFDARQGHVFQISGYAFSVAYAPAHVDPLLALHNVVCSDRWDEAWAQILRQLRQQARQRRVKHQPAQRLIKATPAAMRPLPTAAPAPEAELPAVTPLGRQRPNCRTLSSPSARSSLAHNQLRARPLPSQAFSYQTETLTHTILSDKLIGRTKQCYNVAGRDFWRFVA